MQSLFDGHKLATSVSIIKKFRGTGKFECNCKLKYFVIGKIGLLNHYPTILDLF